MNADLEKLIQAFERNQWVINAQTEGLSHSDSLLQLPFRGNCLNWVLGHIVVYRDKTLTLLGGAPTLTEAEADLYLRGSEPITDGVTAVSLERLLSASDQSQKRLTAALQQAPPDTLAALYSGERQQTVGDRVVFMLWHETYHVGQLEILRQLAGKEDTII